MTKAIFITATDTHVGKTVATLVIGTLLKAQGHRVGIMKPVQCAGDDAQFLKKSLSIDDDIRLINPCYAPEPLSPHLAFRRSQKTIDLRKIKSAYATLKSRYDTVIIEGAGGLMVPLMNNYYNADLIKDLNVPIIIVSRLGLGTINHTLLTVHQAKSYGLKIKGIIFSDTNPRPKGIAEQTNPEEIARLSKIKVLGTIPYLKSMTVQNILKQCQNINVSHI